MTTYFLKDGLRLISLQISKDYMIIKKYKLFEFVEMSIVSFFLLKMAIKLGFLLILIPMMIEKVKVRKHAKNEYY